MSSSTTKLTPLIEDMLKNVDQYGGVIASLTLTLLADIMNSDPLCVKDVHESGLAKIFFDMLLSGKVEPTPELVLTLPNVISAFSLTDFGSTKVEEVNPFPALMKLFHSPQYVMPHSRSMQNDLPAIFGTNLDEVIRHVPKLRPHCIAAIVQAMKDLDRIGQDLVEAELNGENRTDNRTEFIQYVHNLSMVCEQVLMKNEHAAPFVEAGGIDYMLNLYNYLLPPSRPLLARLSCVSNFSLSHLSHFAPSATLTLTLKSIAQFESCKMIDTVVQALEKRFANLSASAALLRTMGDTETLNHINAEGILSPIPSVSLHMLPKSEENDELIKGYAKYLRSVLTVEWLTSLLGTVVKTVSQKSEISASWSGQKWQQGKEGRKSFSSSSVSSCG